MKKALVMAIVAILFLGLMFGTAVIASHMPDWALILVAVVGIWILLMIGDPDSQEETK